MTKGSCLKSSHVLQVFFALAAEDSSAVTPPCGRSWRPSVESGRSQKKTSELCSSLSKPFIARIGSMSFPFWSLWRPA